MDSKRICIYSFIYLTLIVLFLRLLHILVTSQSLTLDHQSIRIKKQPLLPLRFSYDGTFKILQVADMHYGNGLLTRCRDVLKSEFEQCSDLNTTQFLRILIEVEKPDFVAFTGDNIFGTSATDAAESLFGAFGPVLESGVPWAAVLGNHDQESTLNREELMSFISLMDYSLSQTFPSVDTTDKNYQEMLRDIDGFGNYDLRVWGAPSSPFANTSVLNLYFLDSGDRATVNGLRTYDWIKESQLNWLRGISKEYKVDASLTWTTTPPALVFFHIPIPEIRQGPIEEIVGTYREHVACSSVNSGVLQTLTSMEEVKAVFVGHDHTNDFCGKLKGLWFCYGGGIGYHGYGKAGWPRRARIILAELGKEENSWTGVEKIRTWKRLNDENLSKIDEQVLWHKHMKK